MEKAGRILDKGFSYFNMIYQIGATIALCLTVVTCLLQVASRYITFVKILGMEELARMGFVWMVSLSLSLCVAYGSHLKIDMFSSKVPDRLKPLYSIFLDLIILIYLAVLFRYSVIKCAKVGHQVTIVFLIQMKYLYSALIVGSAGGILNTLHLIFNNICTLAGVSEKKEGMEE